MPDMGTTVGLINSLTAGVKEDVAGKLEAPSTAGTSGQVLVSDGNGGQVWGDIDAGEVVIDSTLSVAGAAADAAACGDLKTAFDNVTQKTRNLFDKSVLDSATGISLDSNGYYAGKVSAWVAAFSSELPIDGTYVENTRYTISFKYYFSDVSTYTGNAVTFKGYYADETNANLFGLAASVTTATFFEKPTANKSFDHFAITLNDWHSNNYILHIKDLQIEAGIVATDYVPHLTAYDAIAEATANANTSRINAVVFASDSKLSIHDAVTAVVTFDDWEVGDINSSGANNDSSTTVIRTAGYHRFPGSYSLFVSPKNSYKCGIKRYTYANGSYTYVSGVTASTSEYAIDIDTSYYYRFVIAYNPGGQSAATTWANNVSFVPSAYAQLQVNGYNKAFSHRCLKGYAPEETKPGILLSKKYGFDYFECDIQFTSDNVPVLIHDSTINRTSNGTGNVSDYTFAQLQEYDFGSWYSSAFAGEKILSLEQALQLGRALGIGCCMQVQESITDANLSKVINTIVANDMQKHVIIQATAANIIKIYALRNDIDVALVGDTITDQTIASLSSVMTDKHTVYFMMASSNASTSLPIAKAANVPVITHTVNTSEGMASADSYISGALSDYYNYKLIKYQQSLC